MWKRRGKNGHDDAGADLSEQVWSPFPRILIDLDVRAQLSAIVGRGALAGQFSAIDVCASK
jgi:hypothetical protein